VEENHGRGHARSVPISEDYWDLSFADAKPSTQTPVAITSPHAF